MDQLYRKITTTGLLPDGRVITQYLSNPLGYSYVGMVRIENQMMRAFPRSWSVTGEYL